MRHRPFALAEGLFLINYADGPEPGEPRNELVVIIRDQALFGSDRHGGVYAGEIDWHQKSDHRYAFTARVICEAPLTAELVAGALMSGDGAPLPMLVSGTIDPALAHQIATIEINGVAIDAAITVLGSCQALASGPSRRNEQGI